MNNNLSASSQSNLKARCSVCLDRITISGKFHAEQNTTLLHSNKWRQIDELDGRPTKFKLNRIDENGEIKETLATLVRSKYKANTWRFDTSNHFINDDEKAQATNIIARFDNPHVTRIDIAFDFINYDNAGMKYRLYKPNAGGQIIYDRAKQVETITIGKRKSRTQYRYYDKTKEQYSKNKNQDLPQNWERLEIQIRDKLTKNWLDETRKMLSYFKRPNLTSIADKDTKSFFMLIGIEKHPEYFNKLSKRTVAKYRKMIKENQGFDDTLAKQALEVLEQNTASLKAEIESFYQMPAKANKPALTPVKSKPLIIHHLQPYNGKNFEYQCNELVKILNQLTGKHYTLTHRLRPIFKQCLESGITLQDIKQVIEDQQSQNKEISIGKLLTSLAIKPVSYHT